MKNKIYSLVAMLTIALSLTSCLKDNEKQAEITFTDTAITGFSIDEIKVMRDSVNAKGKDTTYITKVKLAPNSFYIDQAKGLIYNPDSLPYGTKITAIVAKLKTKNAGSVRLKSAQDENAHSYIEKDSIDFTKDSIFQVYAQDGKRFRNYTVKVNVHKEKGYLFTWKNMASNAEFEAFTNTKAVYNNGRIYVFGSNGSNTTAYTTSENDGNAWTKIGENFDANAYQSVIISAGYLYTFSQNQVMRSKDGAVWNVMGSSTNLKQLVAASTTQLFAIGNDGNMWVSVDNGATWNIDDLSDDKAKLPTNNTSFIAEPLQSNEKIDRVVLIGNTTASNGMVRWTKLIDYSEYAKPQAWTMINNTLEAQFQLPYFTHSALVNYNNNILALGTANNAFLTMKESTDGGVIWKANKLYKYPNETPMKTFAATVDAQNYIWIVSGSKVWRGRLNCLGWKQVDKIFVK